MPTIRGPEEVYRHYLERFGYDEDGDPDAVALFTFSLVERDKFDWIEHYREQHRGASPSQTQIDDWYVSKPGSYFEDKYRHAMVWYQEFARAMLQDEIEFGKRKAIRQYIGNKLEFWPQIRLAIAGNFIFACIVGLLAMFIFADFSPIAWMRSHTAREIAATNLPVAPPLSAVPQDTSERK